MFSSPFIETHLAVCTPTDSLNVLPEEAESIAHAAAGRQQEFLLGRTAARKLLGSLGVPSDQAILRTERGAPIIPATAVCSIAHTAGVAVAFGALRRDVAALGADIERLDRTFRQDVSERVCASDEERRYATQSSQALLELFTAKESLYKALNPITDVYFGFQDAVLEFDGETSDKFHIELRKDLSKDYHAGRKFLGTFLYNETYCLALVLERQAIGA